MNIQEPMAATVMLPMYFLGPDPPQAQSMSPATTIPR
jgi:hypothetical protein